MVAIRKGPGVSVVAALGFSDIGEIGLKFRHDSIRLRSVDNLPNVYLKSDEIFLKVLTPDSESPPI